MKIFLWVVFLAMAVYIANDLFRFVDLKNLHDGNKPVVVKDVKQPPAQGTTPVFRIYHQEDDPDSDGIVFLDNTQTQQSVVSVQSTPPPRGTAKLKVYKKGGDQQIWIVVRRGPNIGYDVKDIVPLYSIKYLDQEKNNWVEVKYTNSSYEDNKGWAEKAPLY